MENFFEIAKFYIPFESLGYVIESANFIVTAGFATYVAFFYEIQTFQQIDAMYTVMNEYETSRPLEDWVMAKIKS
jgi:hypothetical protein